MEHKSIHIHWLKRMCICARGLGILPPLKQCFAMKRGLRTSTGPYGRDVAVAELSSHLQAGKGWILPGALPGHHVSEGHLQPHHGEGVSELQMDEGLLSVSHWTMAEVRNQPRSPEPPPCALTTFFVLSISQLLVITLRNALEAKTNKRDISSELSVCY